MNENEINGLETMEYEPDYSICMNLPFEICDIMHREIGSKANYVKKNEWIKYRFIEGIKMHITKQFEKSLKEIK